MSSLNILLNQSFTHMADSEAEAQKIVDMYKQGNDVKKSNVTKKVKKGNSYWVVSVTVTNIAEKDAYDSYFGDDSTDGI